MIQACLKRNVVHVELTIPMNVPIRFASWASSSGNWSLGTKQFEAEMIRTKPLYRMNLIWFCEHQHIF